MGFRRGGQEIGFRANIAKEPPFQGNRGCHFAGAGGGDPILVVFEQKQRPNGGPPNTS